MGLATGAELARRGHGVFGLRRSGGAARVLERVTGVLFIGLGVRLALAGRR